MAGALWTMTDGDVLAVNRSGDAAGLTAAKTIVGGVIFIGPGLEALVLGAFSATQNLVRITNTGIYAISGFHMADILDPTKLAKWDVSAITTGTTRILVVPNYGGNLVLASNVGSSGQVLQSNGAGVAPSYGTLVLTNALLDGVNHTDTLAGSVVLGDLITGNATPKWARLAVGSAGQVLTVVAGAPAWSSSPTAVDHSTLTHIAPLSVASCSIANGSDQLDTATANGFATVRVGDFVRFVSSSGSALWGAKVDGLIDSDSVSLDKTNTTGATVNSTVLITPGDHWNDTASLPITGTGFGLFLTLGRGTYDVSAFPAGTFQEIRGPINHEGYESGHNTDVRYQGSTSIANPYGFCLKKGLTGARMYFMVNALTGTRVLTLPDVSDEVLVAGTAPAAGNVLNKTFGAAVKYLMDETGGVGNGSAFRDRSDTSKGLGFDLTPIVGTRAASWPNYNGRVRVEGAPVTFADTDTTPSVSGSRVFKTANTGATTITAFDDAVDGQEISVIAGDNNTQIGAGANMKTPAGANVVLTTDDVCRLVKAGATWYVQTVSVNA